MCSVAPPKAHQNVRLIATRASLMYRQPGTKPGAPKRRSATLPSAAAHIATLSRFLVHVRFSVKLGAHVERVRPTKALMRSFLLAILALLASPQLAHSQTASPSPIALVGVWAKSDQLPNGATMSARVVMSQNMKFSGTVSVNGNVVWEYSGSWSLAGNVLTWNYEVSSRPLPESAKVDTDEVVSAAPDKLVLLSKQSGKQHEFLRTK